MILIIGGMGFIGLHTTLRLVEAGESVVITQFATRRVPAALEPELDKRVFVERMDVTDAYNVFDVMRRRKVDSIINLMAPPARGSTRTCLYLWTLVAWWRPSRRAWRPTPSTTPPGSTWK